MQARLRPIESQALKCRRTAIAASPAGQRHGLAANSNTHVLYVAGGGGPRRRPTPPADPTRPPTCSQGPTPQPPMPNEIRHTSKWSVLPSGQQAQDITWHAQDEAQMQTMSCSLQPLTDCPRAPAAASHGQTHLPPMCPVGPHPTPMHQAAQAQTDMRPRQRSVIG